MAVTPSKDYKRQARELKKIEKRMAREAAKAEKKAAEESAQKSDSDAGGTGEALPKTQVTLA